MSGEKELNKLLASIAPLLSDEEYVFCSLVDPDPERIEAMEAIGTFREQEGITVILNREKAEEQCIEYSGIFRCITLRVHSSLEAVGLTAAVATKLAEAGISANVVAGFFHDHIFVPSVDATAALSSLKELSEASGEHLS